MDPFIKGWASQYFGKGLGLAETPNDLTDNLITTEYRSNFESISKKFMGLDRLTSNEAKTFLTELKSNKLYAALYVLPILEPVAADKWQIALRNSVKAFTSKYVPYFGICSASNTSLVIYVDESSSSIVGKYPHTCGTIYPLIPLSTKGVNNDVIGYLTNKDPVLMTEQEITAVDYLVESNVIDKSQLNTTIFNLPNGTTTLCNALDIYDIPYKVRILIRELPPALVKEHNGNVYEAVRAYAVKNHNDFIEELNWLDKLYYSNSGKVKGMPTEPTLNDEMVKDYLIEHYGMSPSMSLRALFSNPSKYLSSDTVASEIAEKGITRVFDAIAEDPDYCTGTLDELIENYCKTEGIDTKCTISQLLHHINYVCTITPPDVTMALGDYIVQHPDFNTDTSIKEFLTNTPHKDIDVLSVCMECIDSCACIDSDIKRALRKALVDGTPLSTPTLEELIDSLEISDEAKKHIQSVSNGGDFKTVVASNRILSSREQAVRDSASYILNGFRDYLLDGDTPDKRIAGQVILYSYMKILYAGMSSIEADRKFLLNKVSECTDAHLKKILEDAIDIYTK